MCDLGVFFWFCAQGMVPVNWWCFRKHATQGGEEGSDERKKKKKLWVFLVFGVRGTRARSGFMMMSKCVSMRVTAVTAVLQWWLCEKSVFAREVLHGKERKTRVFFSLRWKRLFWGVFSPFPFPFFFPLSVYAQRVSFLSIIVLLEEGWLQQR